MKLFNYPKIKKFKVRARNLTVSNKKILNNYKKVSTRISKHGIFILGHEVENFEKKLSKFLNTKYVVAVNSGTSAIYLALKCLNLSSKDEVITTPMSWLVSSTTIKIAGGKPVFADVDDNFNLDPDAVKKKINSKTKAILVVHFYGKIAQIQNLRKIANEYNIPLIEDSAQAFGAKSGGKYAGTYGDFGTFSFSPMKVFGSFGNAGAIVFKDKKYLNILRSLRTCGTINREICNTAELKFDIDPVQAALINENFNVYNELKQKRIDFAKRYFSNLSSHYKILPKIEREYNHTFYDYTILVNNRDKLIKYLYSKGIEVKIRHPILINHQPLFKNLSKTKVKNAEYFINKILSLPMHYNLNYKQIDYVCEHLIKFKELK